MNQAAPVYRVKDWDQNFEGAKSRTYNNKSTCQMPTKHGLGYRKLIRHKNGPSLFGAWCALIQVLSRHPIPREGYCTDTGRADGRPLTATDLELLTDIPEKLFAELLQVASSKDVAWLGIVGGYHADTAGIHQGGINSDSDSDSNSDSNSDSTASGAHTEHRKALNALYRRRDSTPWSAKEARAFRELVKRPDFAEELASITRYFAAMKADGREHYLRHDLKTLLNNWAGELDRAENFKPSAETQQPRYRESRSTL